MYIPINTKTLNNLAEHEADMVKSCPTGWGKGFCEGRAAAFGYAANLMEEAEAEIARMEKEAANLMEEAEAEIARLEKELEELKAGI